MLGLEADRVMIADHDPDWTKEYTLEAAILQKILHEHIPEIEHFGSTAVPGLKAKPIIDILVGLQSFEKIEAIISILENAGYLYAHWAGIPDDYTFRKGNPTTHLIHVVLRDSPNWNCCITVRNALREDPALAEEYASLKEKLAERYPDSREQYGDGKTAFINKILKKAAE